MAVMLQLYEARVLLTFETVLNGSLLNHSRGIILFFNITVALYRNSLENATPTILYYHNICLCGFVWLPFLVNIT